MRLLIVHDNLEGREEIFHFDLDRIFCSGILAPDGFLTDVLFGARPELDRTVTLLIQESNEGISLREFLAIMARLDLNDNHLQFTW